MSIDLTYPLYVALAFHGLMVALVSVGAYFILRRVIRGLGSLVPPRRARQEGDNFVDRACLRAESGNA